MRIIGATVGALLAITALFPVKMALAAPPDWIAGNPAAYPAAQYLIGRGAGSTEEEAKNRARGDLATIFEVRVKMVSENATTVAQSGGKEQIHKMVTQQVSARTDKVISGILIAEIWRDPETMEYHALAVLSRARAAAGLREEIGELDEGIQMELDAATTAVDPLRKIANLARAMQAAIKRDAFQASLKIVDSSGRGITAPVSQLAIQAQTDEALRHIRIIPEVAPPGSAATNSAGQNDIGEFEAILKNGLGAAGLLAQDNENADFRLTGKLVLSETERQNNWYWMRGTVEISLAEKSGRIRGGKTWPVKVSARDNKTVRARMWIEIEKLFKQSLRATIIEFASGPSASF